MGVHKNAEHESGYFEDEEEGEEVSRRVMCNKKIVRDKSDDNHAEIRFEGGLKPGKKRE
jgi:hypothetical protein